MDLILLSAGSAVSQSCTFGAIDQGNWISISTLIVLLSVTVGALVYAVSSFLPTSTREKLRGTMRIEMVQGILALFIILILVAFAGMGCQLGGMMTNGLTAGVYQDPFQFAQLYLNNLLFIKSGDIFVNLYTSSINYLVAGNLAEALAGLIEELMSKALPLSLNANVLGIFYGYASVATSTYTVMMMVSYGILFVMWLMLYFVQSFAMTLIAPLALLIRTVPYGGPKLREVADTLLAIAVAFYFVLPLALTFNNYTINWMFCTSQVGLVNVTGTNSGSCNPYVSYTQTNFDINLPVSSLLSAQNGYNLSGLGTVVGGFFGGAISGNGGLANMMGNVLGTLAGIPGQTDNYGVEVAEYMFTSIVLIALDVAITLGFAQGLARGLVSVSGAMNVGPFWGSV